jgi:hypothetical protein
MNFPDFQRQIQIVTDPAEIEKWKEEARKVTTYSTLREEPAVAFSSITEAERHFERNYLPGIVKPISEVVVDGPASRQMHDRVLNKVIENEWNRETRSPSPMMQELAARFRDTGLQVFRHRRGMLFVSPIYPRPFRHDEAGVSAQVRTIMEAIGAQPRIGRKELADKMIKDLSGEDVEKAKLALASDLLWLINAGYVIEFNDGSLDLPRAKTKPKEETVEAAGSAADEKENTEAGVSAAEKEERVEAGAPASPESGEGGPAVGESSVPPKETEDVVAAAVSAAEPNKQALGTSASTTTQEESEIGGS